MKGWLRVLHQQPLQVHHMTLSLVFPVLGQAVAYVDAYYNAIVGGLSTFGTTPDMMVTERDLSASSFIIFEH
eukprot:4652490-Amphidinium_carterae.1